jgi:hypothetical protein
MFKRTLWFLLLLPLFAAAPALAATTDVYFAQTAAGANDGSSCANAHAYDDGANGINKAAQWVAGNTLHLCGTISVPAAANIVAAQASGTSGHPITIKFETGAILQSPAFGSGGTSGIVVSNFNFITIDGGTNGLIQNTHNGTAGTTACPGGACTSQVNPTTAIEAMNSNDITIENLDCDNMYDQTAADTVGNTGISCIHFQGTNVAIHDNTLANAGEGIDNTEYGNDDNTQIYGNDFHEDGWALGCAGGSHVNTNYQFFDNHVHGPDRWANGGGATHINGIHCFGGPNAPGTGIQQLYLYNNVFDGNMGPCCWTSWVYLESNGVAAGNWNGNTGTVYAFNNVFVDSLGIGNGSLQTGGGVNHLIVNNAFYGAGPNLGKCLQWGGTGVIIENNVFNDCGQIEFADPHSGQTPGYATIDYNVYGKASDGNALWSVNSITESSFPSWQTACACDGHGQGQLGSLLADITNEGVPSAGYIGIGAGTNLSSLATGKLVALANDTSAGGQRTPNGRPGGSKAWDVGAYEYCMGSGCAPPIDAGAGDGASSGGGDGAPGGPDAGSSSSSGGSSSSSGGSSSGSSGSSSSGGATHDAGLPGDDGAAGDGATPVGGCGCRLAGGGNGAAALWAAALSCLAVFRARRKRR